MDQLLLLEGEIYVHLNMWCYSKWRQLLFLTYVLMMRCIPVCWVNKTMGKEKSIIQIIEARSTRNPANMHMVSKSNLVCLYVTVHLFKPHAFHVLSSRRGKVRSWNLRNFVYVEMNRNFWAVFKGSLSWTVNGDLYW